MTRTRDQFEKLWHRKKKIEYLRYEEEKKSFAKVAEYSNDGECHACKVAERVADKNTARIPI
jgi:hypothetical protein